MPLRAPGGFINQEQAGTHRLGERDRRPLTEIQIVRKHESWDNDVDVKVRDIVKQLEDDGWSIVRQRGSHRQFKHATKPGLVTVAGKPGDDVAPGTLNSMLKQAELKP